MKNPEVLCSPHDASSSSGKRQKGKTILRIRAFLGFIAGSGKGGIKRETMLLLLFCPVALYSVSCDDHETTRLQSSVETETIVQPGPPVEFSVQTASPESLDVFWESAGSMGSIQVIHPAGDSVSAGDTIALGIDSMTILDLQLAGMNLSLARARIGVSPEDPETLQDYSDAMGAYDSIEASIEKALIAPSPGRVVSVSDSFSADRAAARLLLAADSLFSLVTPPGVSMVSWPAEAGDLRFLESDAGSALYSGFIEDSLYSFPGSFSVPRQAVRSSGLSSFMVMEDGDTVSIMPICHDGALMTLLAPLSAGRGIKAWTRASEGE